MYNFFRRLPEPEHNAMLHDLVESLAKNLRDKKIKIRPDSGERENYLKLQLLTGREFIHSRRYKRGHPDMVSASFIVTADGKFKIPAGGLFDSPCTAIETQYKQKGGLKGTTNNAWNEAKSDLGKTIDDYVTDFINQRPKDNI